MFQQTGFLLAVARAAQAYLLARLVLGLFGHDLYEIYWWFVTGLALSLLAILPPEFNSVQRIRRGPHKLWGGASRDMAEERSPHV